MNSDRVLGAIAILVAAAMTVAAWGYVAKIEYEPVGPRAVPLLLAALMALCGAWLVARPAHQAAFGDSAQVRRIGLCAACIVLYAIVFQVLGFVVATALMSIPVGRMFGGTWKQSALAGIGMGLVLFVLFDTLLDVVLPAGLLKPLFASVGL